MLNITLHVLALVLPATLIAQETAAPSAALTLDLEVGTTFAYGMANETEMDIHAAGSKLRIESKLREDLAFEVVAIDEHGNFELRVRYARIQGQLQLPMQPRREYDSDLERPSFAEDALVAGMLFLVGLETTLMVSPTGEVLEFSNWDEAMGAHASRVLAGLPEDLAETWREAMLETMTAETLSNRIQFDLQRFPEGSQATSWPMRLLVPGQADDRQMVMVGMHRSVPAGPSEEPGSPSIAHEGKLELLDPDAAEPPLTITESEVTGETTLDPASGRIVTRNLEATISMRMGMGEEEATLEQHLTFAITPIELSLEPQPDDNEDDPFK